MSNTLKILAAIVTVALVTALLNGGHGTSSVIHNLFAGFANSLYAAMGKPNQVKYA